MKIEWYPGHMKKARDQIVEKLSSTDLFLEVLDARLPGSSSNPLLDELRGGRPCLKVLTKEDLADPATTKAWVTFLEQQQRTRAFPLDARERRSVALLPKLCRRLLPHRGQAGGKPLRVMVVGIPNVGKSTLINSLAGRKMARVGDRPAITTCPQQVDLRNGILLHDTPGMLWPVMEDPECGLRLATSGAVGENAFDTVGVALWALRFLSRYYAANLTGRFRLQALPESPEDVLETIGRRRGCLVSGGDVDLHRAAELLLRELRSGKLGRISIERPPGPDDISPGASKPICKN